MEDTKSNNIDLPRNRSRSKNKDDNMSEYQEMKGSLKDMQIMLDGLNKMQHPEKKIKFEKKKRIDKKEKNLENMLKKKLKKYQMKMAKKQKFKLYTIQ